MTEENKPTIEQALWVIDCLYEGWKGGYSMRGMVQKLMGFTEPGAGSLFQIHGLLTLWNALEEYPEPIAPPSPPKPARKNRQRKEKGIPSRPIYDPTTDTVHRFAIVRWLRHDGEIMVAMLWASPSDTEDTMIEEWKYRHPLGQVLEVTFREPEEKKDG